MGAEECCIFLARLAPLHLQRRATRIVELVGFAETADAAHGRPALIDGCRQMQRFATSDAEAHRGSKISL
jgi:hypothetical protein